MTATYNVMDYNVLIPYQQGSPFRQLESEIPLSAISLNPLSAGKSFQTWK